MGERVTITKQHTFLRHFRKYDLFFMPKNRRFEWLKPNFKVSSSFLCSCSLHSHDAVQEMTLNQPYRVQRVWSASEGEPRQENRVVL